MQDLTQTLPQSSTRTSASASAAIPINTMNANGIAASTTSPSSSLVNTPSSGGAYVTAGTSPPAKPSIPSAAAAKRRRSAPSVTLATQLSQLNNRHIYSHTKQTRSVIGFKEAHFRFSVFIRLAHCPPFLSPPMSALKRKLSPI